MMRFRVHPENQSPVLLQERIAADSQQQWEKWLEEIAEGKQSALGSLYQDTSPMVFGLILRIIADRAIAEEVLMEVFKQVWKEAALFNAQRLRPLEWILTIARSRALACLRLAPCENECKTPNAQESLLSAPQTELENMPGFSSRQQLARAALASLSPIQRQVFELAYYGGLTPGEIAARVEMPLVTVKNHLQFAMMRLREFFSPVIQEQL